MSIVHHIDHRLWTAAECRNSLFTSESRYTLYYSDISIQTCHERGHRYYEHSMDIKHVVIPKYNNFLTLRIILYLYTL